VGVPNFKVTFLPLTPRAAVLCRLSRYASTLLRLCSDTFSSTVVSMGVFLTVLFGFYAYCDPAMAPM